jgi:hypothetical protein
VFLVVAPAVVVQAVLFVVQALQAGCIQVAEPMGCHTAVRAVVALVESIQIEEGTLKEWPL